jgi:hypothetical protein
MKNGYNADNEQVKCNVNIYILYPKPILVLFFLINVKYI